MTPVPIFDKSEMLDWDDFMFIVEHQQHRRTSEFRDSVAEDITAVRVKQFAHCYVWGQCRCQLVRAGHEVLGLG